MSQPQQIQAQYVVTVTNRNRTGRVKREDVRKPCDRVQITDNRENDGTIIIELIRSKNNQPGIDVETCVLSSSGDVAYIANSLTGKTIKTVNYDKDFKDKDSKTDQKEQLNKDKQQHLRI